MAVRKQKGEKSSSSGRSRRAAEVPGPRGAGRERRLTPSATSASETIAEPR